MTDENAIAQNAEPTSAPQVDLHLAYAEASVMLVECLMLVMIEKKLVPLETLIEAVETAIETKQGQIKGRSHPHIARIAAGVLSQIANSINAGALGPVKDPD